MAVYSMVIKKGGRGSGKEAGFVKDRGKALQSGDILEGVNGKL